MPKPITDATRRALERVAAGVPPFRAAIEEGIDPSTVYRALKRERDKSQRH